jgi:putative Holliday junction resolvase
LTSFDKLGKKSIIMKLLGLDYGEKGIGLALADSELLIAHGHGVIERTELAEDITRLLDLIQAEGITRIIIGLPKKLNNTISTKAQAVLEFVEVLKLHTDVPIALWDERLTTVQAEHVLCEAHLSRAKKKRYLHTIAAQFILQSYLEANLPRCPSGDPEE